MSGARWEYRDTGSGFGHLQRVAGNAAFTRSQRAYQAYLDHGRTCVERGCEQGDALWRAYQDARGEGKPP